MNSFPSAGTATLVAVAAAEAAPPAAHGHEHAHSTVCLNCDTALTDKYCGHCGQPAATHRITLKHLLLHDLPHSIWHVDKGVVYTFWQMLTRPGLTIRGYLAGQRIRQFHPISYMLLLVGLTALLMSAFQPTLLKAMVTEQTKQNPALFSVVGERYLTLYLKHPALGQFVLLPLNTLAAWLLLRRKGYNFAELLLANSFVLGTLTILNTAIMLPTLLSGSLASIKIASQLIFIPTIFYSLWVNAQLLATSRTAVRRYGRALGIALLQAMLMLVAIMVFVIVLTVQVLHERPDLRPAMPSKKPQPAAIR